MTIPNSNLRKTAAGAMILLTCVTLLSCVSSFVIYRSGFADLPSQFQTALALCCVLAVEGCFAWLIYGFATSFSSGIERSVSLAGIVFLFGTMAVNIVTHYQIAKRIELNEFQRGWIEWGGVAVVVAVLAIVLLVELGNPDSRLRRLELRVSGIEREAVLQARRAALETETVLTAIEARAAIEAERLARRISDEPARRGSGFPLSQVEVDDAGKTMRRR
jgi:signal transduction histidine kinase